MNNFEKHLRKNKKQLELNEINSDIWSAIEESVGEKKKGRRFYLARRMTAVAAVLLLGFTTYQLTFSNPKTKIPKALLSNYGFENSDVTGMLETKIKKIKATAIPVNYKDNLQVLLSQANYLDRRYESQLTYLKEKEYEEEIAKEVLKYYKAKSNLLDKVISEIKRINDNEKEYNIKSDRTYIEL